MMDIDSVRAVEATRQQNSSHQRQPSPRQVQDFKEKLQKPQKNDEAKLQALLALITAPLCWFNTLSDKFSQHIEGTKKSSAPSGKIDPAISQLAASAFPANSTKTSFANGELKLTVVLPGNLCGAQIAVAAMQSQEEKKKYSMTLQAATTEQVKLLKSIKRNLEITAPAGYDLDIQIKSPNSIAKHAGADSSTTSTAKKHGMAKKSDRNSLVI